jgi:hypothetical protein
MTTRNLIACLAVGAWVLLAAGCGEKPMVYKQGHYQGKVDSKPWDNDRFKGSQVEWEKTIKTRNQSQNEYSRDIASAR